MDYWLFMFIAVLAEVAGTLAMKSSSEWMPILGLAIMYFMLILSYGALAIATKRIPLTVAYGAWESLGLVLISLLSAWLFAEPLNVLKMSGIAAIIMGIFLLEMGTSQMAPLKKDKE